MHQRTGAVLAAAGLSLVASGWGQETRKPGLTAEQVIEKSIQAAGSREATEKLTSSLSKGTLEVLSQGVKGSIEVYAKAPNKRLLVTYVESYGEVLEGFDGKVAWSQDPTRGLREAAGDELVEAQREAIFNAALRWRELYPKAELMGKEKVGEREAYAIRLTPSSGKPITRYYDVESFLVLRQVGPRNTPQGMVEAQIDLSDYRDIDGVKAPFQIKQTMPIAEVVIKITEIKNNIAIEDARFAKPAASGK